MAISNSANVEELKKGFKGKVITPNDPEYEGSRKIWNGMVDKRPVAPERRMPSRRSTLPATMGLSLPSAARATTSPATRCATMASSSIFRT